MAAKNMTANGQSALKNLCGRHTAPLRDIKLIQMPHGEHCHLASASETPKVNKFSGLQLPIIGRTKRVDAHFFTTDKGLYVDCKTFLRLIFSDGWLLFRKKQNTLRGEGLLSRYWTLRILRPYSTLKMALCML